MKLLNSFLITTQSSVGGLSTLYARNASGTSSLFWRSETGTIYDLGASNGRLISSSATYIYAFTGSNTSTVSYTWSRPSNAKYIKVIAVGAGGGGGSGAKRRTATRQQAQGGGGGGGGALVMAHFSYNQIPGNVTVTLRPPGTGGLAVTTNTPTVDVFGFNGQAGGATTFGSLVTASGGSPGTGGNISTPLTGAFGGLPSACTPNLGFSVLSGGAGGDRGIRGVTTDAPAFFNRNHSSPSSPFTGLFIGSAGGGCGGGIGDIAPLYKNGSSGSSGYQFRDLQLNTSGAPGSGSSGATGGNGTDNLVRSLTQLTGSAGLGLYGLGGGGHGGGSGTNAVNGGTGGNGND